MNIKFTLHAKEQMHSRKILPIWVDETVKRPDFTTRKNNKYYAEKQLNGKRLKVVLRGFKSK